MKDNISSTKKSKKTRIVVYSWWFVQALVVVMENLNSTVAWFSPYNQR